MTLRRYSIRSDSVRLQLRAIFFSILIVTSVLATSGVGSVAAIKEGPQPVTCGVIDSPGSYHLTEDITGVGSTCIEITSSDVTLDGNGHSISADDPDADSYGIYANGVDGGIENIVIRNVNVRDFDATNNQGIRFEGVTGGDIANVEVTNNDLSGIELYDTSDVTVSAVYASGSSRGVGFNYAETEYVSTGNTIADSDFTGNRHGIIGQGMVDTTIRDSTLNTNERPLGTSNGAGFYKLNGENTTIERTSANDNPKYGFRVGSGDVTIVDSEASRNGDSGVFLDRTSDAHLENNTMDDNHIGIHVYDSAVTGHHTILDSTVRNNDWGIWLRFSNETVVSGTTATGNDVGIKFWDTYENTISDTYATDNVVGIDIEGSSSGVTTFSDNVLIDNTEWAFKDDGGHNYVVENLDIGASTADNTTVNFEGDGVSIGNVSNPDFSELRGIGRYFEAEGTSLDIDVAYRLDDLSGEHGEVNEHRLTLWKYDGSSWSEVDGSTVDTEAQTVSASITEFSIFGVFETEPPAVDVSIDGTNEPVMAGEDLNVTVTVETEQYHSGTLTVELQNSTGSVLDSKDLTLDFEESKTFNLTWSTTASDAGEHTLTVDGETDTATTTVTVDPLVIEQFDVTITDTNAPITAGETLNVDATIIDTVQFGDTIPITVELRANGDQVDSADLFFGFGEEQEQSVSLQWETTTDDVGAVSIEVDTDSGSDATTVTIDDSSSEESGSSSSSETSTPAPPPVDPALFTVAIDDATSPVVSGEAFELTATVENTGEANGTQSVELRVDGSVVDSTAVFLESGSTETVTLSWIADVEAGIETIDVEVRSDDDADVTTVSVEEPIEANVILYGASADREHVNIGETVTVSADLYNAGTITGDRTVSLSVDGDVVDETTVDVPAGLARSGGELTWTPGADVLSGDDEETTVTLSVDGLFVGSVTVEHQYTDIQVIAASVSDDESIEGEKLYAIGSIYQAGTIEGTQEIELTATNTETGQTEVLGTQEVTLSPGYYHLGALNISFELDAGTYEIELGDRSAGTVEIEPAVSDIQVIAASVSEIEIVEGEEVHAIGSIYQAGNVGGNQEIELTATNTETGETQLLGSQEVTLAPGYYHLGALNISFELDAGTYEIELGDRSAGTVEVEAAVSDIQVIAAGVSEIEVVEGEELHAIGSIYQAGTIEGTQEIELTATNTETGETETLGSQEVTLSPGFYHLGALNISFELDAGTYEIELGDRSAGTVEVEPAISDIQVIAASVSKVEIVEGEEVHAIGSIYQAGTVGGTQEIELTATNTATGQTEVLGSQEVTLTPGFYHLGGLNVSFALNEPGTYEIELGDRSAGTVEVEESDSDIQVIAASVSDVELLEGERTHVVGSIYQNGTNEGPQEIELLATNTETGESEVVGTQEVTLQPGFYHLGAINITYEPDSAGTYELTLGGREAGTVAVDEAITDIQVIAAGVSKIEIVEGEEVHAIGSIYQAGNVEGTQEIELTATNEETGESEVVGTQEVTLSPGFYHLGAINISFEPDSAGTYDLTLGDRNAGNITVEPAVSDIQVIAASVSEIELIEGEEVHAIGSIYQAGTVEGTQEIELTATNTETGESEVLGSQEVTLSPGFYHLGALNISFELNAGTYEIELGDRSAGIVEVEAAVSDIQVIAASVSEIEIVEGDEIYAIGSIYQAGTVEGTQEIELTATNTETGETQLLGSQEATLSPGFYHLGALNVSFELNEPGTYEIELGDRSAGTVEVEPAVSDIQVIAASVSEIEVVEGETAYAIGSIYQAGTIEGPQEIELTATNTETGQTEMLGSQEVTLRPGWYHLGGLNVSFELNDPGTYEIELGDRSAGTVEVRAATVDPSIVSVDGHSTDIDLETGDDLVFASDSATVEVDVVADLDVAAVTLLVESLATNYAASVAASPASDERWVADVPFEALPDDGRYALSVVAVDEGGNAGADESSETLVIDRDAPSMAVTLTDVAAEDATIVIESAEPLSDVPTVTAALLEEDGTTTAASVTMDDFGPSNTEFTGTLAVDDLGEYVVTAIGTDRAGNEVTEEASATVHTAFTLADGIVELDGAGMAIEFHLAEDADQAIASQELFAAFSGNGVHPGVDDGDTGVGFVTAALDSFIDHHLEEGTVDHATVSMAFDEAELDGVSLDEIEMHHYDEGAGAWEPVETTHEFTDTGGIARAQVTHFSTYGALVPDDEPPTLVDVTPEDGSVIESDIDEITVAFEYADDRSGIDVRSVSMQLDGVDVTRSDGTQITSSRAEHTFTIDPGTTYEATVTVSDYAGNTETFSTEIALDDTGSAATDPVDGATSDIVPEDQAGFGPAIALLALLVGAFGYRWRRVS